MKTLVRIAALTTLGLCTFTAPALAQRSVSTLFGANNLGSPGGAVYFDVEVISAGGISITDLEINTQDTSPFNLDVYVTTGTSVGAVTTAGSWTLVSSGSGTGLGLDNPTPVDIADFALTEGTWGMAIALDSAARHNYTNGTGTEVYLNADLVITPYAATSVPFSGTVFQPRIWNGSIYYQVAPATNVDAGPFLAAPMAYTVDPNTRRTDGTLVGTDGIYSKKDGLIPGADSAPLGPRPDFRFAALFRDMSHPSGIAQIEVDAMSIGADKLWVDPVSRDGRITTAPPPSTPPPTEPGRWMTLSLSVHRDTTGTSGTVGDEAADSDGAAADVFNYVPRGVALPSHYLGRTYRSIDGSDLDLDPPSTYVRPDIRSLDAHLSAYSLDERFVAMLPSRPTLYFSVTSGTVGMVPNPWWNFRGSPVPIPGRSGATIFATTWVPGMSGTPGRWTRPEIYFMPRDLGLVAGDDVDALAMDFSYWSMPGDDVHIVYSTTSGSPSAPPSELMFVVSAGTDNVGTPASYMESDGTPVASRTGTGTRIDSVCGSDPGPFQSGLPRFLWGTPVDTSASGLGVALPLALSTSSMRSCYTPAGGRPTGQIRSYMSGWLSHPPLGSELALYFVTLADPANWVLGGLGPSVWSVHVRGGALDEVLQATVPYPVSAPALLDAGLWTFWASAGNGYLYSSDLSYIRI